MIISPLLLLAFLSPAGAIPEEMQPMSVREALEDHDRNNVPDRMGRKVAVEGTLIAPPRLSNNNAESMTYLQDATAGIRVQARDRTLVVNRFRLGDEVRISGTIDHFDIEGEIMVEKIERLESGQVVEPAQVPIAALRRDQHNGKLVRLRGKLALPAHGEITSDSVQLEDSSGKILLFISQSFLLSPQLKDSILRGGRAEVVGIVERYYDKSSQEPRYLIRPRDIGDFHFRPPLPYRHIAVGAIAAFFLLLVFSLVLRKRTLEKKARDLAALSDKLRASEAALQETNEKLATIVRCSPLAIVSLDREGKVQAWNPAAEQMFGWIESEVIGKVLPTVSDTALPEYRSRVEQILQGRSFETEVRPQRKDGSMLDARLFRAPLHCQSGEIIGSVGILEDITVRKRAENALRESEERFRTLTEKSTDLVVIVGVDHLLKYVSPSAVTVLGYDNLSLIGTNLLALVHAYDRAALASWLDNAKPGHEPEPMEFRMRRQDGFCVWMESTLRNLVSVPNIGGLVINARNVGERKDAERELAYRAFHDSLTQLPNRALFTERVEAAVHRARRHPGFLAAVLFMDMDDFKVINDSLGHDAGDEFIREIGRRLLTCLRTSDAVGRAEQEQTGEQSLARMGGDEFTVLLEDIVSPADALRVADRIQSALAQPFVLAGQEVYKSASIGIAVTKPESTADELLRNADIAMYRAKSLGGARSEMFDTAMHSQVMHRLKLESELRRAIEREEFRLQYQPIVALETGRVAEFEALLRWERPGVGLVYPADFLPVAEESGLIRPIGEWVLRQACTKLREWNAMRPDEPPISMAVNVSGKQFNAPGFAEIVADVLRQTGIQPSNLHLEITESVAMEDAERTRKMITDLKNLGVQLMLDDFGTGYSSMSYLRRFEVDTLKIDRSFVTNLHANRENRAIVNTIIKLAAALQIKVIAEGVETAPELDELRQSGCRLAQGWLFAKSLDEDAVVKLLSSKDGFQNVLLECATR